jgi:hypothetical protein
MAKTMRAQRERMGAAGLEITGVDKLAHDASQVGVGIIAVLAALIGIWGIACLIGGFAGEGVLEMVNGYISAVTGR